jgi:hypothetical protein
VGGAQAVAHECRTNVPSRAVEDRGNLDCAVVEGVSEEAQDLFIQHLPRTPSPTRRTRLHPMLRDISLYRRVHRLLRRIKQTHTEIFRLLHHVVPSVGVQLEDPSCLAHHLNHSLHLTGHALESELIALGDLQRRRRAVSSAVPFIEEELALLQRVDEVGHRTRRGWTTSTGRERQARSDAGSQEVGDVGR